MFTLDIMFTPKTKFTLDTKSIGSHLSCGMASERLVQLQFVGELSDLFRFAGGTFGSVYICREGGVTIGPLQILHWDTPPFILFRKLGQIGTGVLIIFILEYLQNYLGEVTHQ